MCASYLPAVRNLPYLCMIWWKPVSWTQDLHPNMNPNPISSGTPWLISRTCSHAYESPPIRYYSMFQRMRTVASSEKELQVCTCCPYFPCRCNMHSHMVFCLCCYHCVCLCIYMYIYIYIYVCVCVHCLLCPLFVMSAVCYVHCLLCPSFVMSAVCYIRCLLCPLFVMSAVCYVCCFLRPPLLKVQKRF